MDVNSTVAMVGDEIIILDGEEIQNYCWGWFPDSMSHLVGNQYEILSIIEDEDGIGYKIYDKEKEKHWVIDTRGCVIAKRWLNTDFDVINKLL